MNRRRASLGAFAVGASALALAVSPLPTTFAAEGDAGRIYVAGSAAHLGEPGEASPSITGLAATPSGRGYWTVAENGDVAAFGDARADLGRPPALAHPLVDVAGTRSGNGYWLAARDGGVFAHGDAVFRGSLGDRQLVSPITGIAPTPGGAGYWLVAADGGVYSFGSAQYRGRVSSPSSSVTAIASSASGMGYWVVTAAGAVTGFGDARTFGDLAGSAPGEVVALVPTASGQGYWLATKAGTVHAFGDARDHGGAATRPSAPVADLAVVPGGSGYWFVTADAPPAPPAYRSSAAAGEPSDADFDRLAHCESTSRWNLNSGNGYYGGLQFSASSWRGVGGTGLPHEHPREVQIEMGRRLWRQAGWGSWPHCSRQLGYR